MAVRISVATGTSPDSWYQMQAKLDLWEANRNKPKDVRKFDKPIPA